VQTCPVFHENSRITNQFNRILDQFMIKASSIPQFPYCPANRSQPRNLRVSACRDKTWDPPEELSKGTRSGSRSNQLPNRTPNELCSWTGERSYQAHVCGFGN
jgi:hypothetical protein